MKKEWEIKRIGQIVTFHRGLTYSKNDEVDFSHNIVLRSNNVNYVTNQLDLADLRYIDDKIDIPKDKKVKKGSLIICTANGSKIHLGKVALIEEDYGYAFGGFMGQITPSKEVDSKFLYYSFISELYKKFINELSDGVNINNLKFDDLKEFTINIPPLTEQSHIVSILDKAFAAIDKAKANTEKNLQNAKKLFESYLENVFAKQGEDWEVSRLGDICEIGDGNYSSKYPKASEFISTGVPFLTATNLKNGVIVPDGIRYISKQQHSLLTKGHIKENDLVIVVRGSSTGNNSIVSKEYENSNLNSQLAYLRVKSPKLDSVYLFNVFNSPRVKTSLKKEISGAAQPQLPNNKLLDLKISYPNIVQQQLIVKNLNSLLIQTKKLESIYQQKLNDLEELKKSILQKAFNGELTKKEIVI